MATFKIILYKSKTLKDGSHPVILQVVHKSKPYKISLGYKSMKKNWDEAKGRFKKGQQGYKLKNGILKDVETKAEETLDKINKWG